MVRQFGSYKDSRNIWVRMRPETVWEGDGRRSKEERILMANEEAYRHVADEATTYMLENIKSVKVTKKLVKKEEKKKKAVEKIPRIENVAADRLQRLTQLSRRVGMGISLKYGDRDDEAMIDSELMNTFENRSRIAFPPVVVKDVEEEVVEEKKVQAWEPVFANIDDEKEPNSHTMYPSVFQSLRYVTNTDSVFGLKVDKVSELLTTSGIEDNMYASVVFQLGYKFPRTKKVIAVDEGTPRLPDETKSFVLLPEGYIFGRQVIYKI